MRASKKNKMGWAQIGFVILLSPIMLPVFLVGVVFVILGGITVPANKGDNPW